MKIGIFGGTFDPFTTGHAAVVVESMNQYCLDKVVIVPTTVNYYRKDKRYLFTFDEKVEIIQDFIARINKPVELDLVEKYADQENWRTIDTVQYFRDKYPLDELYLIIGEDSYQEFNTWTRAGDILKYVQLLVASRSGSSTDTAFKIHSDVPASFIDMGSKFEDCSATNTRNKLIEEIIDLYLSDKEWYNEVT